MLFVLLIMRFWVVLIYDKSYHIISSFAFRDSHSQYFAVAKWEVFLCESRNTNWLELRMRCIFIETINGGLYTKIALLRSSYNSWNYYWKKRLLKEQTKKNTN